MYRRLIPYLSALLLLVSACSDDDPVAPGETTCPEAGTPAPALVLDDLEGATHSLADYRCDQVVVLDFWAIWCSPCVEAMPDLQALHEQWANRGVKVLSVNLGESRDLVQAFMDEGGYTFPVLLGSFEGIPEGYNVYAIPRQVVIDKAGEIRFAASGTGAIAGLNYDVILPALLEE